MGVNLSSVAGGSFPYTLPNVAYSTLQVASVAQTGLASATVTKAAAVGHVVWEDRGTHDIAKVGVMTATVTAGTDGVLRVSLQDVADTSPAQPDGTADQSVSTSTMPSATTWTEYTFTAPRAAVAHGTLLSVVFELTTAGTGVAINFSGIMQSIHIGIGTRSTYTASWAATGTGGAYTVALISSDGAIGFFNWNSPVTAINTHAFASDSDPKAYGNYYSFPYDVQVDGLGFQGIAGDNLTLKLTTGAGAVLASRQLLANTAATKASARIFNLPLTTPVTIAANTPFCVLVAPDTTTNVTTYSYDAPSAAYFDAIPLGSYGKYAVLSADDEITLTATRRALVWPMVSAIGAPSSIGGGGVGGIGSEGVVAD